MSLSPYEQQALSLTAELSKLVLSKVIGAGTTRDQDVREFVAQIHIIQNMILAQAAARSIS